MIDCTVEGDAEAVRSIASFLTVGVSDALRSARADTQAAARRAEGGWQGQAGSSYLSANRKVGDATDDVLDAARKAARRFLALAEQMDDLVGDMTTFKSQARAADLEVNLDVIEEPASAKAVPGLPGDAGPGERAAHEEAMAEHDAQVRKIEVYDRLARQVPKRFEEHEEWVETNLRGVELGLDKLPGVVLGLTTKASETAIGRSADQTRREARRLERAAERARERRSTQSPDERRRAQRFLDERAKGAHRSADLADRVRKGFDWGGAAGGAGLDLLLGLKDGKPIEEILSGTLGSAAAERVAGLLLTRAPFVVGGPLGILAGLGAGLVIDELWRQAREDDAPQTEVKPVPIPTTPIVPDPDRKVSA